MKLSEVLGVESMADVLTKYVDGNNMSPALLRMSIVRLEGRPACAPAAMSSLFTNHSLRGLVLGSTSVTLTLWPIVRIVDPYPWGLNMHFSTFGIGRLNPARQDQDRQV